MKVGSIIVKDLAIAALAVVLWSPIVGLSPFDPDLLRAALAVTSYIAIPAAAIMVNRPLLSLGTDEVEPSHRIDVTARGDEEGRGDELKAAISASIREKDEDLVGSMASQGTTPRQLTDLIGSLCDLTSGSGDKGTPIVLVQGYFDNYTN